MALGKNLKKKKLISAKKDKKVAEVSTVKKKKLISADKKVRKKSPKTKPKVSKQLVDFVSSENQKRRHSLSKRYDLEIKDLVDKTIQFVVFKIGAEEYAVEIEKVKKVVLTPEISKVPRMPDYIVGIADVRGKIVLAIDLVTKLGLPIKTELNYTLVIEGSGRMIGLLIADLPLTLKIEGKNISRAAGYLEENTSEDNHVKGLIKINGRMIYYLDVDELVNSDKTIVVPNDLMK